MDPQKEYVVEPVGERLVVRRLSQRSLGRVLMPDEAKDIGTEAEVVAVPLGGLEIIRSVENPGVGNNKLEYHTPIKVGDRVLISRFAGVPIDDASPTEDQTLIIKGEDVLAIKHVKEPTAIAIKRVKETTANDAK
jgi:co-chaperonin GroES (HSP10)